MLEFGQNNANVDGFVKLSRAYRSVAGSGDPTGWGVWGEAGRCQVKVYGENYKHFIIGLCNFILTLT